MHKIYLRRVGPIPNELSAQRHDIQTAYWACILLHARHFLSSHLQTRTHASIISESGCFSNSNLKFIYSLGLSTVARDFPLYERTLRTEKNTKLFTIHSKGTSNHFFFHFFFFFFFIILLLDSYWNYMWPSNKRYHLLNSTIHIVYSRTRIHQSHHKCFLCRLYHTTDSLSQVEWLTRATSTLVTVCKHIKV